MADSNLKILNADEDPKWQKVKGAQTEGDPGSPYVCLDGSNTPKSGQKAVASAGTAEALGTTQVFKRVTVVANADNTGDVYVGNDGADDVSSITGIILPPGGWFDWFFVDIADLYVDAEVSTEGVSYGGEI